MRRRFRPTFDPLDARQVPSGLAGDYTILGVPWRSRTITYSIVPDGTPWDGAPSNLQATMNAAPGPAWRNQVASAFASWAAVARVKFRLVADSGAAEGVPGKAQGDRRFGDVRIGGEALGGETLGFAYAPAPAGTLGGDITLNTGYPGWGTAASLAVSLTHEIGHAIGLGHAADPGDIMYPIYGGTTHLGAGDVAGVRVLYGRPRPVVGHRFT